MGKLSNTKEFIKKAEKIHGNKYDYSLVDYSGNTLNIKIICPTHGLFEQSPNVHISQKSGCQKCGGEKVSKALKHSKEEFIKKAMKIHGNAYDYSITEYNGHKMKIINVICPKHGIFNVHVESFLSGAMCNSCKQESKQLKFISEATTIHNGVFDYSKVYYVSKKKKVEVVCQKHGSFFITPDKHLGRKDGCPSCRRSHGEVIIEGVLTSFNYIFIPQKRFSDCVNPETKYQLPFDFYLPSHNTCIEYDGDQHFRPLDRFGGQKALDAVKKRDKIKTDYCLNKGIHLFRINYKQNVQKEITLLLNNLK